MSLISWQEFSRRPHIQRLPMHEQKRQFVFEQQLQQQRDMHLYHMINGPAGGYKVPGPTFTNTQSLLFDGVNDYVDISNAITLVDDFSISAWIEPSNTTDTYNMILSCGSVGPYFAVRSGGKLHFYLSTTYETNAGVIQPNVWTHVAVTRTSGVLQLYINGTAFGTTSTQTSVIGSQTYNIGRYQQSNPFYFTGNIDELALFNSALSSSDVTSIYNSGVPNDIDSLNPLSWWRFEGSDITAIDSGTGGNNGTINGATRDTDFPV